MSDHNLLTTPNDDPDLDAMFIVEHQHEDERQRASPDVNGILRNTHGQAFSEGAYEIVEAVQ